MTFLLGLIGRVPLKWWGIGAAALAVLGLLATQSVRIHLWQHDYAEVKRALVAEKADRAVERDQAKDAALVAGEKVRALQSAMQQQKDDADAKRTLDRAEIARLKGLADSYSSQLGGLRQQLADAASGGRPASEDSVADCRRRADAIADVLAQVVRLDAEAESDLTDAAEREAADARSLRAAWPVTP